MRCNKMFKVQGRKRETAEDGASVYAAAFESAPAGALLLHGEPGCGAMILRANAAAREILGKSEEDLQGAWLTRPGILLSTPEEFADAMVLVDRVLAGDLRHFTVERKIGHRDGLPRLVKLSIAPLIPDAVGEIDGYAIHAVVHIEDITEQRQAQLELQYRAGHDSLTGLINRRRFTETLIQHLAEGRRYGEDGALLLVDIDSFKEINENHGQVVGDRLLKLAAARMAGCLRGSDQIGRLGGDEFAILLPSGGVAEGEKVAEKLLGAFYGSRFGRQEGASDLLLLRSVSMSIGITPLDGSWPDPDAAYSAAYSAMSAAKAAGGDGIAIRHGRRSRPD